MKRRFAYPAVLLLVALAALGGTLAGRRASEAKAPSGKKVDLAQPTLMVPADKRHVGEVWESEKAVVRVPFVNTGLTAVTVTGFQGDCSCTATTIQPTRVAPGEMIWAEMVTDLTERTRPHEFGLLTREFTVRVTPTTTDGWNLRPQEVTVTCRSHVATATPVLHFGESNRQGRSPRSRVLGVTVGPKVARLSWDVNSPAVTISDGGRQDDHHRLIVIPDTGRQAGQFVATLTVTAHGPDGGMLGTAKTDIVGDLQTARGDEP